MVKRKCKYCQATTTQSVLDFYKTGWIALSFNGKKVIYACPKHNKQLKKEMYNTLENNR